MNNQTKTTYGELKCRKAELRDKMEKDDFSRETVEEYRTVLHRIRWEETWLLWTIVSLMLIFAGCQTFKGATGDSAWMLQKLSDNVQTHEK